MLTVAVGTSVALSARPFPGFSLFSFFSFVALLEGEDALTVGVGVTVPDGVEVAEVVGEENEGIGVGRSGRKSVVPGAVTAPTVTPSANEATASGTIFTHTLSPCHRERQA